MRNLCVRPLRKEPGQLTIEVITTDNEPLARVGVLSNLLSSYFWSKQRFNRENETDSGNYLLLFVSIFLFRGRWFSSLISMRTGLPYSALTTAPAIAQNIFLHIPAHVCFKWFAFDNFCFKESQNFNPKECKNTEIGFDYRGTLSLTKSGKPCKVWISGLKFFPNWIR